MEIKVGDNVGFKCDVEQHAEVIEIKQKRDWQGRMIKKIVVKAPADGFSGEYIRGCKTHELFEEEIW